MFAVVAFTAAALASPASSDLDDVVVAEPEPEVETLTLHMQEVDGTLALAGHVALSIDGATPGAALAILGGAGIGGEYVHAGKCGLVSLWISGPIEAVGGRVDADHDGTYARFLSADALADVGALQVIDLETCALSNAVAL